MFVQLLLDAIVYIRKNSPGTSVCLINKKLASNIISIWEKAGIPIIALNSVLIKLSKLVDAAQRLLKYSNDKRTSAANRSSMQSFEEVFDICPCICFDNKNRDCKQYQCNVKAPLFEWDFWLNQKGLRNMTIGNTDKKEAKKLQTKFYRKSKEVHHVKNSISVASATTFYDDKICQDREVCIPTEFSSEDDKE